MLTTRPTHSRPIFRAGCALKIRTYDVRYRDGSRGIIRADATVVARMISGDAKSGNLLSVSVRGY